MFQSTPPSSLCRSMPHRFILSTGHLSSLTWVSVITLREIYVSINRINRTKTWSCFLAFVSAAVMVGDRYIVSGRGSMALNMTHPSPLDDNRLEYRLRLTPDLLPEMEELLLPGPLQEEINIQVRRRSSTFENWKKSLSNITSIYNGKKKYSKEIKWEKLCAWHLTYHNYFSLCRSIASMERNMERKRIQTLATSSTYLPETVTWQTSHLKANGLSSQHPALSPVDQVSKR